MKYGNWGGLNMRVPRLLERLALSAEMSPERIGLFNKWVSRRFASEVIRQQDALYMRTEDGRHVFCRLFAPTQAAQTLVLDEVMRRYGRDPRYVADVIGFVGVSREDCESLLAAGVRVVTHEYGVVDGAQVACMSVPMLFDWVATSVSVDMRFVLDWYQSLSDAAAPDLRGMTFHQALARATAWHERIAASDDAERRRLVAAPPIGEGERVAAGDEAEWVRLVAVEALRQEGARLGHCVGRGGYDRYAKAVHPEGIWSLRRGGESLATAEVAKVIVCVSIPVYDVLQVQASDGMPMSDRSDWPPLASLLRYLRDMTTRRFHEAEETVTRLSPDHSLTLDWERATVHPMPESSRTDGMLFR